MSTSQSRSTERCQVFHAWLWPHSRAFAPGATEGSFSAAGWSAATGCIAARKPSGLNRRALKISQKVCSLSWVEQALFICIPHLVFTLWLGHANAANSCEARKAVAEDSPKNSIIWYVHGDYIIHSRVYAHQDYYLLVHAGAGAGARNGCEGTFDAEQPRPFEGAAEETLDEAVW